VSEFCNLLGKLLLDLSAFFQSHVNSDKHYKPEFGIRTSLNRCFLSGSSLFRHLKSRRSSATPATLNALRLEANKNQQFSFVLNPNSGYKPIFPAIVSFFFKGI
jgi:hypothetical protein